jgi:hypothetical protein
VPSYPRGSAAVKVCKPLSVIVKLSVERIMFDETVSAAIVLVEGNVANIVTANIKAINFFIYDYLLG